MLKIILGAIAALVLIFAGNAQASDLYCVSQQRQLIVTIDEKGVLKAALNGRQIESAKITSDYLLNGMTHKGYAVNLSTKRAGVIGFTTTAVENFIEPVNLGACEAQAYRLTSFMSGNFGVLIGEQFACRLTLTTWCQGR